jgi:hypothetical protein
VHLAWLPQHVSQTHSRAVATSYSLYSQHGSPAVTWTRYLEQTLHGIVFRRVSVSWSSKVRRIHASKECSNLSRPTFPSDNHGDAVQANSLVQCSTTRPRRSGSHHEERANPHFDRRRVTQEVTEATIVAAAILCSGRCTIAQFLQDRTRVSCAARCVGLTRRPNGFCAPGALLGFRQTTRPSLGPVVLLFDSVSSCRRGAKYELRSLWVVNCEHPITQCLTHLSSQAKGPPRLLASNHHGSLTLQSHPRDPSTSRSLRALTSHPSIAHLRSH